MASCKIRLAAGLKSCSVVQASDKRCGLPLTKLIVRAKHPDQLFSISKHNDDFFWKEVRQGKEEPRGSVSIEKMHQGGLTVDTVHQ